MSHITNVLHPHKTRIGKNRKRPLCLSTLAFIDKAKTLTKSFIWRIDDSLNDRPLWQSWKHHNQWNNLSFDALLTCDSFAHNILTEPLRKILTWIFFEQLSAYKRAISNSNPQFATNQPYAHLHFSVDLFHLHRNLLKSLVLRYSTKDTCLSIKLNLGTAGVNNMWQGRSALRTGPYWESWHIFSDYQMQCSSLGHLISCLALSYTKWLQKNINTSTDWHSYKQAAYTNKNSKLEKNYLSGYFP